MLKDEVTHTFEMYYYPGLQPKLKGAALLFILSKSACIRGDHCFFLCFFFFFLVQIEVTRWPHKADLRSLWFQRNTRKISRRTAIFPIYKGYFSFSWLHILVAIERREKGNRYSHNFSLNKSLLFGKYYHVPSCLEYKRKLCTLKLVRWALYSKMMCRFETSTFS